MDCTAVRKKLSAFEDGEVSPALQPKIEAHLATCSDCRQALADLRRLWLTLENPVSVKPRPDFSHEIMRKIAEKSEPGLFNWMRALVHMFPAPAAMAVMVVLSFLIGGWMGSAAIEMRMKVAPAQKQSATLAALDAFAPTPKGSLAQGYFLLVSNATQVER
jgi:predicted anti-sigma-YlaC factor YlaD